MILQERDKEVLTLCYEHQFLMFRSLQQGLWAGSPSGTSRRLGLLEQANYLRSESAPQGLNLKLYRLTPAGRRFVESGRSLLIKQSMKLAAATIIHDALVLDVRLRLRQFWNARWLPETALKSEGFNQIPDGLLFFNSGKKIAIEVENSAKGKARYDTLWKQWSSKVSLVLYVATSTSLFNLLNRYLDAAPKEMPWALVDWTRLRQERPLILTARGEFDLLDRREF